MPGQNVTGFSAFLECIENLDGDKKQQAAEIEATISAMEEQEKLWTDDRAALLDEIQNRLRQELERAGLVPKGENDD